VPEEQTAARTYGRRSEGPSQLGECRANGRAGGGAEPDQDGDPRFGLEGGFQSIAQLIDLPSVMNFSAEGDWPQIISLAFFVGLCCYLYYDAKRAKA
jgi:hypothetical protein